MKHSNPPKHWPLPHHRFAGLPLIYNPPTRTPLSVRLQVSIWRILFGSWTRLRLKPRHEGRLGRVTH